MRIQFLRVNSVCKFKHLGNKKGGINAPLALRLATTVTFSPLSDIGELHIISSSLGDSFRRNSMRRKTLSHLY